MFEGGEFPPGEEEGRMQEPGGEGHSSRIEGTGVAHSSMLETSKEIHVIFFGSSQWFGLGSLKEENLESPDKREP